MITLSHTFIPFLADVTVRATVVLALPAIIAALSRRASASLRHLVWVLGLGCALLMPLLTMALPGWKVAVRNAPPAPSQAAPVPQIKEASSPNSGVPTLPSAPDRHAAPTGRVAASQVPVAARAISFPAPSASIPWVTWIGLLWASGVLLVLAQLAQGLATVVRIARQSVPVAGGPAADALHEAQTLMNIGRPVALRQVSAAGLVTVPLTYGALRPVVVLPAQAAHWPRERLRAALLHELAHVRRGDWPIQVMGHIARALYWFHPLAHLAARRARAESEAAADDLVLASGMPAQDYARQLLDVALGARRTQAGASAVAMAQSPRVEGRLRAVLAHELSRRPVTRRTAVALLAVAVLLALPLAALRLSPSVRAQEAAMAGTFSAQDAAQAAPGGGVVTLVGVSYSPSTRHPWWGKDGVLLPHAPVSDQAYGTVTGVPNSQVRVFALEAREVAADASFDVTVPSATSASSWVILGGRGTARGNVSLGIVAALPAIARTCTVRVGVAAQPWQTVASDDGSQLRLGGSRSTTSAGGASLTVMFSPPSTVRGGLALTVSDTTSGQASRIVALNSQGRIVVPDTLSSTGAGKMMQRTVVFPNLSLRDIKRVQVQARPYHWVEFQNVPLQPQLPLSASSEGPSQATVDTAAAHVALGQRLQRQGQPGDGIPEFRRAVHLDPSNAEAQFQLAQGLYQINWKRAGRTTMARVTPAAILDEAIGHMRRAVVLRPDDADWQSALGTYLENRGRYAEAIPAYRRSLRLLGATPVVDLEHQGPPLPGEGRAQKVFDSHWLLGDVLLKARSFQEAAAHYREALRFRPTADWVWLGYGDALSGSGHRAEARIAWHKCLASQPPNAYYQRQAGERLAKG